jgi:hypothetical protein
MKSASRGFRSLPAFVYGSSTRILTYGWLGSARTRKVIVGRVAERGNVCRRRE